VEVEVDAAVAVADATVVDVVAAVAEVKVTAAAVAPRREVPAVVVEMVAVGDLEGMAGAVAATWAVVEMEAVVEMALERRMRRSSCIPR